MGPLSLGCGCPMVAPVVALLVGVGWAIGAQAQPVRPTTGIGATMQAWRATHRLDNGAAPWCYDPMPGLAGRFPCRYGLPSTQGGRVNGYEVFLRPHTSARTALGFAMAQFPPDARLVWTQITPGCQSVEVTSPSLTRAFGWVRTGGAPYRLRDWLVRFQTAPPIWYEGPPLVPPFTPANADEFTIDPTLPRTVIDGQC